MIDSAIDAIPLWTWWLHGALIGFGAGVAVAAAMCRIVYGRKADGPTS